MQKNEEKAYIAPTKGKTKFSHFSLKAEVLSLLDEEGFRRPTVVQAESLPITLQNNLK
jgi:superfamily II DNA/RNA helicase